MLYFLAFSSISKKLFFIIRYTLSYFIMFSIWYWGDIYLHYSISHLNFLAGDDCPQRFNDGRNPFFSETNVYVLGDKGTSSWRQSSYQWGSMGSGNAAQLTVVIFMFLLAFAVHLECWTELFVKFLLINYCGDCFHTFCMIQCKSRSEFHFIKMYWNGYWNTR